MILTVESKPFLVKASIHLGFNDHSKSLYDKGIKRGETIIGYKELYSYFEGNISLEEAKELIKRNTRRYPTPNTFRSM